MDADQDKYRLRPLSPDMDELYEEGETNDCAYGGGYRNKTGHGDHEPIGGGCPIGHGWGEGGGSG